RQLLDRQDLADHERPLDVGAGPLDRLDLQARRDQLLGQLPAVDAGRELGVLAHPRKRSPHQISIPNGRVNRTSPSTMSYMSSTPCRNISVPSTKPYASSTPCRNISARSTPAPNAQPL